MRKIATLTMILLLAISISVNLASINPVGGETTTIVAQDAHVNLYVPDNTLGKRNNLHYGGYHDPNPVTDERIWLKFDVSGISMEISEVRLYAFLVKFWLAYPGTHTMSVHYSPDDSWSEETITWNNQPSFEATPIDTVTMPQQTAGNPNPEMVINEWRFWKITEKFKQVYSDGLVTFVLEPCIGEGLDQGSGGNGYFWAKEHGSEIPYLLILGEPTPPAANFSATPTNGIYPLTVSFTDQSTGLVNTYSWNFGDGATSYARNPTHNYNVPGTYTASLTVTGPGGSDTETKTNYITVNNIPHGLIDSDMLETDKLKLSALLYHDGMENDPDYDFFAVKVTLEDKKYKNIEGTYPMLANIYVEMSDFCEEVPSNHKPEAGSQGEDPSTITYSFFFISFNLQTPAYWVDYTEVHEGGHYKITWSLKPSYSLLTANGPLFEDYAEFAVGVRVPAWSKPYATVYADCVWYKKTWVIMHYEWVCKDWDEVGWAVVDPAGAETFTPTTPEPINAPESLQQLYLTVLAEENGTSLTMGDVYINDEYVGHTNSTFPVAEGTNNVSVSAFWEAGVTGYRYGFQHWENDSTENPRTIMIDGHTTIKAHFDKKKCPGDINDDGYVNVVDVGLLSNAWASERGDANWDSSADLNYDSFVNIVDLGIVSDHWMQEYEE